jgi:hypothetical protein
LSANPELLDVEPSQHGPRLQRAPDQIACRTSVVSRCVPPAGRVSRAAGTAVA